MNKTLLSSLIMLSFTFSAQAEEWTLFSKNNTTPKYALALIAGSSDLDEHDSSGDLYGAEISFICPFIQASEHTIRQQISITKFQKKGFDMYTLEANPHYLYQLESNTYLGFGPSIGVSSIDGSDSDNTVVTFGLGASLHKNITPKLFLGAEFRTVYATDTHIDNVRLIGKVGYYFNK